MDHTQEKFHTPSKNPELTLKTDGDVYYAIPTADNAAKTYPAAEFPCYTINNTQALLSNLRQKTGTPDGNTQSTVESVETSIPHGNCHYALVQRGHLYMLEEREYDPHTPGSEYTRVSAIGYVNKTIRLIHATLTAIHDELQMIDSPDALLDRICNPDPINSDDVRKIAHDPQRPTLSDYGLDKNTPPPSSSTDEE